MFSASLDNWKEKLIRMTLPIVKWLQQDNNFTTVEGEKITKIKYFYRNEPFWRAVGLLN